MRAWIICCFSFLFLQQARSWNAGGHMAVAQIAYNHLDPAVKAKCDALLALNVFGSTDGNSNFVTAACWADDIKGQTSAYNIWHFIDIPFSLDGAPTDGVGSATFDVVRAINLCVSNLASSATILSNQAVYLRFLLHFVGDIHQPLHASTAVSSTHLNGDAGGNSFSLNGTWSNLHSLWDAGGGYVGSSFFRPLSSASQNSISNIAFTAESHYPFQPNPGFVQNPM